MTNTPSRIILVGQNLFFQGRVEMAAEPLGYSVRQAKTAANFWEDYQAGATALVLVDLEGDAETWTSVLEGLQEQAPASGTNGPNNGPNNGPKIVAFGPHEDTATMERAAALGAHQTLNKGRFSATLASLVAGLGEVSQG